MNRASWLLVSLVLFLASAHDLSAQGLTCSTPFTEAPDGSWQPGPFLGIDTINLIPPTSGWPPGTDTAFANAAQEWGKKCPSSALGSIPGYVVQPPGAPATPSYTNLNVVWHPNDRPPSISDCDGGNGTGYAFACFRFDADHAVSTLDLYGICPSGMDPADHVCDSHGRIDWAHAGPGSLLMTILQHELGHGLGLGHDLESPSCAGFTGVMRSSPTRSSSLQDFYCSMIRYETCDQSIPGGGCPQKPQRAERGFGGMDPCSNPDLADLCTDDGGNTLVVWNCEPGGGSVSTSECYYDESGGYLGCGEFAFRGTSAPLVTWEKDEWVCTPETFLTGKGFGGTGGDIGLGPDLSLSLPSEGATVSGVIQVMGAAAAPAGTASIAFFVDGQPVHLANWTRGLPTTACGGAYSDPACPNIGFSGELDTTGLAAGAHRLQVVATDQSFIPKPTYYERQFVVAGCGDSVAPTATIIAPAAGSTQGSAFTVSVRALDNTGVTRVNLYLDNRVIKQKSHAPFDFALNARNYSPGSHTFRALALDACGNAANSASLQIQIQIDSTVPTASLTSPAAGARVSGTVPVQANAGDNLGVTKVELYADGNLSATDTASPWAWSWATGLVADGNHTLQAKAYDAAGNVGTSSLVTVRVDNTPPAGYFELPAPGSTVSGGSVQLFGWASDASGVASLTLTLDGGAAPLSTPLRTGLPRTDVCAAVPGDPNCPNVGWDAYLNSLAVTNGTHTVRVVVTDNAGLTATLSRTMTVSNVVDTTPPGGFIEVPANTAAVSGTNVQLAGWASDASRVTSLRFLLDGQNLALNSPFTYAGYRPDVCALVPGDPNCPWIGWEAFFNSRNFANGSHTLQVIATDGAGLTTTLSRTFVISNDTTPPGGFIEVPANAAAVSGTNVPLSGWASDASRITSLRFLLDGQNLALNAPYSSGYRPDICAVVPGDPNCPWVGWLASFNSRNFANGSHTLQVIATDGVGLTTTLSRTFVIVNDFIGPTVSFSSPLDGAKVTGSVPVQVNATDDVGVTWIEVYLDGALKSSFASPSTTWIWSTTGSAAGNHTLQARAYDASGKIGISPPVAVSVDNTPPGGFVEVPANAATVSGTNVPLSGWASDASRITSLRFLLDGQNLTLDAPYSLGYRPDVCGVVPGDPNCPWVGWLASFNSRNFANGNHTLQIIATDGAGLTATLQRTFRIAN